MKLYKYIHWILHINLLKNKYIKIFIIFKFKFKIKLKKYLNLESLKLGFILF